MKKLLISITLVITLLVAGYYGYNYYNGPKIVDGVASKGIGTNGKPVDISTEFSTDDDVYFTAKANRFWIKKADVVWYKGKIATENRFLVEEDVAINDDGYFTVKLSVPEGLEEGHYGVNIYSAGRKIVETSVEFNVKK